MAGTARELLAPAAAILLAYQSSGVSIVPQIRHQPCSRWTVTKFSNSSAEKWSCETHSCLQLKLGEREHDSSTRESSRSTAAGRCTLGQTTTERRIRAGFIAATSKNNGTTHPSELLLYALTRAHGSVMLVTKRRDKLASSPDVP